MIKTKYEIGFAQSEIDALLESLNIEKSLFDSHMLGRTFTKIDNDYIFYHCDVYGFFLGILGKDYMMVINQIIRENKIDNAIS
jgi:hypothetical protein